MPFSFWRGSEPLDEFIRRVDEAAHDAALALLARDSDVAGSGPVDQDKTLGPERELLTT